MKVRKPQSKRVPVRLRHKIEKASAAKQRKQRKLAKKNPEWRTRLKKDPGIPNLFPYKDKILHEIEESKRRKEEDALRRREEARARRRKESPGKEDDASMVDTVDEADETRVAAEDDREDEDGDQIMNDKDTLNPMAALLASARARAVEYDHEGEHHRNNDMDDVDENYSDAVSLDNSDSFTLNTPSHKDNSRRAHSKAYQDTISASDIILYVLDARDPLGTRSQETEHAILSDPSKRIILVVNKIDLVPQHVLQAWLLHLRRSLPTLPLRASASAAPNARTFDTKSLTPRATAAALLKALKNYAATSKLKRSVSVGIVGYPNVGKSSVINALTAQLGKKNAACPVGAEAGITTSMREVKLDSKIKLLDSPGIVFPASSDGQSKPSSKDKMEEQARLILLNAVQPRQVSDPTPAVSLLLRRLSASSELSAKLFDYYGIPPLMKDGSKDVTTDFLVQVARQRGRLGRGGVPNLYSAAQTVLADWRDGRIQGWVEAPSSESSVPTATELEALERAGGNEEKRIVREWAKEFKIEGLWNDDEGRMDAE